MLSRIAHELFWLGRDLTRAEQTARMLDGAFHADVAGSDGISLSWDAVLEIIGAKPGDPALPAGDDAPLRAGDATPPRAGDAAADPPPRAARGRDEVARLLSTDPDSPASIVSCVARARERGRTLRDVVSTEMWEALNGFYLSLGAHDLGDTGPYAFYQEIKARCALFWGLCERTMLRDDSRAFLEAGRRIEEADMVLRMLRVAVPAGPVERAHTSEALALLQAVGGAQAYRRAVRSAPTVAPVVSFLLYDGAYPGSVAAAVGALRDALTATDPQPRASAPVLRLERLIAELELQRRTPGATTTLQDILERVQDELSLVDHDIGDRYFALALAVAHG